MKTALKLLAILMGGALLFILASFLRHMFSDHHGGHH